MGGHVYTCIDWNEVTQTCDSATWLAHPLASMLPTVEQAQSVGGQMIVAIAILAAMSLLLPPRERDDD
jgi:uncharacterized membrane protein YraQ (UPF0718 family)